MPSKNKGFENLLEVHTKALEENSESIVEILQLLSNAKLNVSQKNSLKKIKSELKGIDKKIDSMDSNTQEEDEWYKL